jgi:hypothetical protein
MDDVPYPPVKCETQTSANQCAKRTSPDPATSRLAHPRAGWTRDGSRGTQGGSSLRKRRRCAKRLAPTRKAPLKALIVAVTARPSTKGCPNVIIRPPRKG